MTLLAIDPSWRHGYAYAYFVGEEVKKAETCNIYTLAIIIQTVPDLVVIEEPYLGKNVDTFKKLCYSVGKVLYLCDEYKRRVEYVMPRHWKPYFKLPKGNKELKAKQDLTGYNNDDVCDAILLGKYYLEKRL